jgi:hypothetical protein
MTTFDADMHQALEVYTRIGHHRFREEALSNLSHLYALRGELVRSLDTQRELARSGVSRDDPQTTGWGILGEARLLGLMGHPEETLRRLDDAVPRARDDLSQLEGLATRALTLAQLGDHRRSRDDIAAVLKVMERASTTSYTSIWAYSNAAEAIFHLQPAGERIASSDIAMARRLLVAFKRFARIIPLARPRLALWSGAFASGTGRPRKATRAWKRALGEASRIGLPLDLALMHFWIGRCSAGEERVRHLTEAIRSFDRMQAAWHAAYARRLLERPAPHRPAADRVPNE